jgi:hypothetical protein
VASLMLMRYLIECDGCKTVFGNRDGFESLTEARASAYAAGWRFPSQLTAHGVSSARTSDACPACVPDWKPERCGTTGQRQRALTRSEVEKLK